MQGDLPRVTWQQQLYNIETVHFFFSPDPFKGCMLLNVVTQSLCRQASWQVQPMTSIRYFKPSGRLELLIKGCIWEGPCWYSVAMHRHTPQAVIKIDLTRCDTDFKYYGYANYKSRPLTHPHSTYSSWRANLFFIHLAPSVLISTLHALDC